MGPLQAHRKDVDARGWLYLQYLLCRWTQQSHLSLVSILESCYSKKIYFGKEVFPAVVPNWNNGCRNLFCDGMNMLRLHHFQFNNQKMDCLTSIPCFKRYGIGIESRGNCIRKQIRLCSTHLLATNKPTMNDVPITAAMALAKALDRRGRGCGNGRVEVWWMRRLWLWHLWE